MINPFRIYCQSDIGFKVDYPLSGRLHPVGTPEEIDPSGYVRGKPRTREVGSPGDRRIVFDVNDVVRDIVARVIDDAGLTQTEAATAMGYAQSTLHAFLQGRSGKLDLLTGLCALLDSDPVDVLAEHPLFADSARSLVRPKDHLFKRFTTALRNRNADRLVRALESAKKAGKLDEVIELVLKQVELLGHDDGGARSSERKPAKSKHRTR